MKKFRQVKREIIKKHPNATNIKLGNNGIVDGVWYDLPTASLRYFKPLV